MSDAKGRNQHFEMGRTDHEPDLFRVPKTLGKKAAQPDPFAGSYKRSQKTLGDSSLGSFSNPLKKRA